MDPKRGLIGLSLGLISVWHTGCQSDSSGDEIGVASGGTAESGGAASSSSSGSSPGFGSGGRLAGDGGATFSTGGGANGSEATVTGGNSSGGAASGGTGTTNSGGRTADAGSGGTGTGGAGGTGTGESTSIAAGGLMPTGGRNEPNSGGSGGSGDSGGSGTGVGGVGPGGGVGGGVASGGTDAQSTGGQGACFVTIASSTLSTVIPTVGIVEWTTDLPGITEAEIEFGLDTNYGMTAPVDLNEANYRTLLLGMKAGGRIYHFRVIARAGDQVCVGEDNALPPTGEPPNSLPLLSFTPAQAEGLDGGFLVFETLKQTFGTGVPDSPVYIVDGDGDFVWWYVDTGIIDVGRARQSYDGKYMWISAVNVLSQQDRIIRVNMDGTGEQDFTSEFADLNHDFAVHSDGTIAFLAYGANGCDDVKERSTDGTVTTIINSGVAVGASACHCNAIQYDRNDDTIVFSELDTSSIVKVSRDTKEVVWVMSSQNAANATVTGIDWVNQHGIHIIDPTHLLFFNNGTGPNASAIEAELSISGGTGTATQVWSYSSDLTVQILGDVQRLPNGNTLVTFSTAGEIREVDPSGTVLQTIRSLGSGNLFGFAEKRTSLYGPPPR